MQDFFLACGRYALVRLEHEGGTAAWVVGTLVIPSGQRHGLPLPQELRHYQSLFFFFEPLVADVQKASLTSLFCSPTCSGT